MLDIIWSGSEYIKYVNIMHLQTRFNNVHYYNNNTRDIGVFAVENDASGNASDTHFFSFIHGFN